MKSEWREVAEGRIWEKKTLIAPGVYLEDGPGYGDAREWDENCKPVKAKSSTLNDVCPCGCEATLKDRGHGRERCKGGDNISYTSDGGYYDSDTGHRDSGTRGRF